MDSLACANMRSLREDHILLAGLIWCCSSWLNLASRHNAQEETLQQPEGITDISTAAYREEMNADAWRDVNKEREEYSSTHFTQHSQLVIWIYTCSACKLQIYYGFCVRYLKGCIYLLAHKGNSGEENSPAVPAWFKHTTFRSQVQRSYWQAIQAPLFGVSSIPHIPTVAQRKPPPFCQKCRLQVTPEHAHTLDPMKSEWADYAAVQE